MRTSLNNIKTVEDYLFDRMEPGDAVLFEANMLLNTDLKEAVRSQQRTYAAIEHYSRKKLKAEIAAVEEKLSVGPQHRGFMQRIFKMFKN